jgi:signal transduction histidine kinase
MASMAGELEREIHGLKLGQHLCQIYEDPAVTSLTIVPYFKDGLERRERCLYLTDSSDRRREVVDALVRAGVCLEDEARSSRLRVLDKTAEAFTVPFQPQAMLDFLVGSVRDARADGFVGLRVCAETAWALGAGPNDGSLFELEALLNEAMSQHELLVICRFHSGRVPASTLEDLLRVDPFAVIGSLVCPNPAYEPPRIALRRCSEEERVRWSLERLHRARNLRLALDEAVRCRDEFLAVAAHELRTPLTSTQLNVQAVLRKVEGDHDRDHVSAGWVASRLRPALDQLHNLGGLVEKLIEASRYHERLHLELEPVDLGELVGTVVVRFEQPSRGAGCRLQFTPPTGRVVGRWDRLRIEQVVGQLLSNAIKYGAGAPVELSVSKSNIRARLVVRDHGIGVAVEDISRIFDRFERAAPITHYGGFGLGLWQVKTIVEALDGTVEVSAADGGGSAFTVELPLDMGGVGARL